MEKDKLAGQPRFPFGMPRTDNGNYIWIQMFYAALNDTGRAGFVMANSASDARASELDIRKQLLEAQAVDVMIAIGTNMFYTVTLPCTLWFLDKGKRHTGRADKILFIDARNIYRQIDRAHREFTPAQIEFIANIVRLYRGEDPETFAGSEDQLRGRFSDGVYQDVAGLCKIATLVEIEAQGWSLNPGRYVGILEDSNDSGDFATEMAALAEEWESLTLQAHALEERVRQGIQTTLMAA